MSKIMFFIYAEVFVSEYSLSESAVKVYKQARVIMQLFLNISTN